MDCESGLSRVARVRWVQVDIDELAARVGMLRPGHGIEEASSDRENEIGMAKQTVFDGQLFVEAGEPRFSLLEIRSESKRLVLSSAR